MPAVNGPQRIVIPAVAGIGNALLAVPMVRQIRRKLPDAQITVLARTDAIGEVFRRSGSADEVVVTGTGIAGIVRMIRASRRRRTDVYLVPFPSNRWQYSMLALTSGAKRKVLHSYPVGYWRAMHFVGERLSAKRRLHDVEQNLELLRPLGLEPDEPEPPAFSVTAEDRAAATRLLRQADVDEHARLIAVHPGSGRTVLSAAKRWPARCYGQLIAEMEKQLDAQIVILEGPDEAGVGGEILKCAGGQLRARIIPLTGPLGEAAALLERANLYAGSDSGLAHLAAAVGTPPVTIFAPSDPQRICPFGYGHLVVQAPVPCAPCFQYPWHSPRPKVLCGRDPCINQVPVESVLVAVRRAADLRATTVSESMIS
jgi:ADP-heptose:LPS heptosyltransferase